MLGNPVVCMTRGGFFRLFYAPGFRKSCCVLPVLSSASPSYFQSMCLKHMRHLAVVGFVFTCFHVVVGFNFTCFHVSWDQAAHYGWSVRLVWCQDVSSVEVLAEAEIPGGEGRGRPYLTLHCHHQNKFLHCFKRGSGVSHFVSLTVGGGRMWMQSCNQRCLLL